MLSTGRPALGVHAVPVSALSAFSATANGGRRQIVAAGADAGAGAGGAGAGAAGADADATGDTIANRIGWASYDIPTEHNKLVSDPALRFCSQFENAPLDGSLGWTQSSGVTTVVSIVNTSAP